jgi:hypothetical protein
MFQDTAVRNEKIKRNFANLMASFQYLKKEIKTTLLDFVSKLLYLRQTFQSQMMSLSVVCLERYIDKNI